MYAVLVPQYVGFLDPRLLYYAGWQLYWCETGNHQRKWCGSGSRNHFSSREKCAVQKAASEDNLPVAVVGENLSWTETSLFWCEILRTVGTGVPSSTLANLRDLVESFWKGFLTLVTSASLIPGGPDLVPWRTVQLTWDSWRQRRRKLAEIAGFPYSLVYHHVRSLTDVISRSFSTHFAFYCSDQIIKEIRCSDRYCNNVSCTLLFCNHVLYKMIWVS